MKLKSFLSLFILFLIFFGPLRLFTSHFETNDKAPIPLNLDSLEFPYPDHIKKLGIEGKIYLQLCIDTFGNVTNVILIKSLHPELDILSAEKVRNLKFIPATQRDKKVAVWLAFPVAYMLEDILSSKDTLTYFDILNNNGKVSDTLNLPHNLTLYLLKEEKIVDKDTTVFIPEEVVYPKIIIPKDFITSKTRRIKPRNDISVIYVEIFLDEKGDPLKYIIRNPATKEIDSLALKTAKTLKFTPAKYLDDQALKTARFLKFIPARFFGKPIPSRFLVRFVFDHINFPRP